MIIPRKKDFFTFYKYVASKKKRNEKHILDLQYFTVKRAKMVNNKKSKTFMIKECRKFHLNKVIR